MLKHLACAGRKKTAEYHAWLGMKSRCTWAPGANYARYGGRGISVCERWSGSFEAFLADMGRKPSPGHTLERIDNDGNYEPGNCRWATRSEQNANTSLSRRLTFRGETLTLRGWAMRLGVKREALKKRLRLGWSVEDALGTPVRGRT